LYDVQKGDGMKHACMSNSKDGEDRSKKSCVCGGHNGRNRKCNKNHNSTRAKTLIRLARQLAAMERSENGDK
jgi:hypothetical protein